MFIRYIGQLAPSLYMVMRVGHETQYYAEH